MVERPDQPVVRIVAVSAILPQAVFVYVVGTMAIAALLVGVAEYRAQVTGFATRDGVLTDQRKMG